MYLIKSIAAQYAQRQITAWLIFFICVYLVFVIKFATASEINNSIFFGTYSLAVSFYILSRFALAYFYRPETWNYNPDYEPSISFAVPSKNEEENIKETILRIANTDYPKEKFNIIAINDGSTDKTLEEMQEARRLAGLQGVDVLVIDWKENRGKREGMAECVRQSEKDIIVFIDSDSFIEPATARELVKFFIDPRIGAVAGHAFVANADKNFLTKMQAARYFVAFRAYKAAEALFGSVTCCSGCCSAYRRAYVAPMLNEWLSQSFLGVTCTYGDDRSLTNYLLRRGYRAIYAPDAVARTFVPDNFRQFMKQQLRWKKSWVRESLIAGTFIWKRNPIMSLSFYLGTLLPLVAPFVVLRALVWYPYTTGRFPLFYLFGLALMAFLYGLYYYIYTKDRNWFYGTIFATFYTLVLIWQLPYAILNLRDARWGTR